MNDRHPSGIYSPSASAADVPYGHQPGYGQADTGNSWDSDPLFGPLPGSFDYDSPAAYQPQPEGQPSQQYQAQGYDPGYPDTSGYGTGYSAGYDTTGTYPSDSFDTTGAYGTFTPAPQSYDSGTYDTGAHAYATAGYDTPVYGTATYDPSAAAPINAVLDDPLFGACGEYGGEQQQQQEQQWDSGAYQTVEAPREHRAPAPGYEQPADPAYRSEADAVDTAQDYDFNGDFNGETDADSSSGFDAGSPAADADADVEADGEAVGAIPSPRRGGARAGGTPAPIRSRRRKPAKRSALLTVAVPSVAVMGVAGVAAATVVSPDTASEASDSQSDVATTAASTKLDKQLASLTADADDFADRASRTQERIDLKERQAAEKKRKLMEAARKEALRPKFALPVTTGGLSAMYGQAGVNWMSLHTGIDFPVSYGTPVRAATDGTVSTKWGGSYGNMVIVTAADGTETWYCHLSSTKIRSGSVKAGDTIAYSGNSGNSTGPHLHFEVHPGGGSAIDPLQWLLNKGLDPR